MARKKKSKKRALGPIGTLLRLSKLTCLLLVAAGVIFAFWYAQQSDEVKRASQGRIIEGFDWLIELDQTSRDVDEVLELIVRRIPASKGAVVAANAEGADQYTFAGLPVGKRPVKILENEGYLVGYDEGLSNPAWVAYRLSYNSTGRTVDRPDQFETDGRTRAKVKHSDYTNTGFDRGHMAPNYAIGLVHGEIAQFQTFLMSNIVPQTPDLNRGPWKRIEQLVANDYLEKYKEIWVITGPIYEEPTKRLRSGVAIPVAFFKVLVDVIEPGQVRVLSMILPQTASDASRLKPYLVSVDLVEETTDLDFFSLLDDSAEHELEAIKSNRLW